MTTGMENTTKGTVGENNRNEKSKQRLRQSSVYFRVGKCEEWKSENARKGLGRWKCKE